MRLSPVRRLCVSLVVTAVTASAASAQWVKTGSISAANDPVWSVRWRGINGATLTPGLLANAATMSSIPSAWNPNLSDTRWMSASPTGSVSVSGGSGTARVEYFFQTTFTATTPMLGGRLG